MINADKTAILCPRPAAAIGALPKAFDYVAPNLDHGVCPEPRESTPRLRSVHPCSNGGARNRGRFQGLSIPRDRETMQDLAFHCPTEWERHHA